MNLVDKNDGDKNKNRLEIMADNKFFDNRILPEYVPTEFAARYLRLSENALRIKVCRGQIRSYKFGRALRFRITDLDALLTKKGETHGN